MKKYIACYRTSLILILIFAVFTLLVSVVDVKPVIPTDMDCVAVEGLEKIPEVGFAGLNCFFHSITGVNMFWYNISKLLGILTYCVAGFFGLFGVYQLVKKKSIKEVDANILILGLVYLVILFFFLLFEVVTVNYRPVVKDLEEGLEGSYPSTHTLLAVGVLGTACFQIYWRVKEENLRMALLILTAADMVVVVVARALSGVHWFTDIVGGIILGFFFVSLYKALMTNYKMVRRAKGKGRNKKKLRRTGA